MIDRRSWWYVGLMANDTVYYVADTDAKEGTVMWCKDRTQAMKFATRRSVGAFVERVMNGRSDIHLVNEVIL